MKKLAIIHTTPVTIPVMKELVEERTNQVELINLLDDSMLPEINQAGHMTVCVEERLEHMIRMAEQAGADAVLSACSSIGGAVEEAGRKTALPVYRIDGPMAEAASAFQKIGVAATLRSTIEPTTELILRRAHEKGREPEVTSLVIEGAGALLAAGQGEAYDALVQEKFGQLAAENEVVVLAQASMARAVAGLSGEARRRFLTSPASGIEAVLALLLAAE